VRSTTFRSRLLRDVRGLRRREVAIEDEQSARRARRAQHHLVELALAEHLPRVDALAELDHLIDDLDARRARELGELVQALLGELRGALLRLLRDVDEDRAAVLRFVHPERGLPGELVFERANQARRSRRRPGRSGTGPFIRYDGVRLDAELSREGEADGGMLCAHIRLRGSPSGASITAATMSRRRRTRSTMSSFESDSPKRCVCTRRRARKRPSAARNLPMSGSSDLRCVTNDDRVDLARAVNERADLPARLARGIGERSDELGGGDDVDRGTRLR
jgi:hypothetical protein